MYVFTTQYRSYQVDHLLRERHLQFINHSSNVNASTQERGIERPVTKHGISQYDHRIIRQTRFQMTIGWLLNVCRT